MSYYFALFLALFKTHTVRLDFKPTGQIVMLNYKSAVIYTDTTALFSMYTKHGARTAYDLQVVQLVRKRVEESKNDTVSFSGDFIPFDNKDADQGNWYIKWAITHLVDKNRSVIVDKNGLLVKRIVAKVVGRKLKNWASVKISYINKTTKEELFSEALYLERSEGPWRY